MRSFLLKEKVPIVKWGLIPPFTFYEGDLPKDYQLAISPTDGMIVIDVDVNDKKNGFDNIPDDILLELENTYNYSTKNNGKHYWFWYSGDKDLPNKTSGKGIDIRVGSKGYVVHYPSNQGIDIRNHLQEIKTTSLSLNKWIEKMFCYV